MRNTIMEDVDIDQLEAAEIDYNSRTQGWHHERWPVGTFCLSESEEYVDAGLDSVLKAVQRGTFDFHALDLSWSERSTSDIKQMLDELTPPPLNNGQDHPMLQQVARINYRDLFFKPGFFAHIRELDLSNTIIDDSNVPLICKLLLHNAALSTLDLSGNELGQSSKAMAELGAAVGSSGLRHFQLNSNPLSPVTLISFLEALPATGCSLHALDVSNVLQDTGFAATLRREGGPDAPAEETLEAARALAALVSDPQRCRSLGHLRANGNLFGYSGVRAITASVVGSVYSQKHAQQGTSALRDLYGCYPNSILEQRRLPNRSLVEVSLLGSLENGWATQEDVERPSDSEEQRDRLKALSKRLQHLPAHQHDFLFRYFAERPWLRRPDSMKKSGRKPEKSSQDAHIFKKILRESGGNARVLANDFQELIEIGSGVDLFNWKALLQNAELQNMEYRDKTRLAAFRVLAAARVIGCRARRALPTDPPSLILPELGPTSGPKNVPVLNFSGKNVTNLDHISPFPFFLQLPSEVRMLILRHLDSDGVLSDQQFNYVVSFACEPSTINYAANLREWTTVVRAARAEKKGVVYSSATLPAQPWSWSDCFLKRSAPRRLGGHDSFSTCVPAALLPQQMAFLEATATQHADSCVASSPVPVTDQNILTRANYATKKLAGLGDPPVPLMFQRDSDSDDDMFLNEFDYNGLRDDYDDDLDDALSVDGLDSGDDFF